MRSDDSVHPAPPARAPEGRLEIRLLGAFAWRLDGHSLPPARTRTEQSLLALLILRSPASVDRVSLAGAFWPDSRDAQALNNLRRSLSTLRRALGAEARRLIAPSPRTVAFDTSGMFCDVLAFDAALKRGDPASLQEALALYCAPLLPDCDTPWLLPERHARETAYLQTLETVADQALQNRRPEQALTCLQQALTLDPYRETAFRLLLETLHRYGDQAGIARAYHRFRLLLHEQLQAAPDLETTQLYQRLVRTHRGAPEEKAKREERESLPLPRLCLPTPLSSLIGREREKEEVCARLAAFRLVTLVGAGGIGKTRLALACAAQSADAFPDGVWFVDLSALSAPRTPCEAVATALGIPSGGDGTPEQRVAAFLAERHLLLVLDNCEHLLEETAALTAALLQQAPGLCVLATSRRRLGVAGEQVWRVPSLAFPGPEAEPDTDLTARLSEYDASRLFLERARAASASFVPTRRNATAILRICATLDGIPLALELAAARIAVLSVEQIADRLTDAFRLLKIGDRTVRPHHRTLQGLVDWSYTLLSAAEQRAFRILAYCVGSWTLEAAEALLGDTALDAITALIDHSLLTLEADPTGEPRYRLLETLRQYGQERLRERGEWEEACAAHRAYYTRLARAEAPRLQSPDQAVAMARLQAEYDNLNLALDGCLAGESVSCAADADRHSLYQGAECAPAEAGLLIAAALWRLWEARGHVSEGRARLSALLAHPGVTPASSERAPALNAAGLLAHRQSDYAEAYALLERSRDLYRRSNDRNGMAVVLGNMAITRARQGDLDGACALLEESLAEHRALGNRWGMALILGNLGALARRQGDYTRSRALLEESLSLRRAIEDREGIAHALGNLGALLYAQGDYPGSRRCQEEKAALCRALQIRPDLADSLNDLSQIALDQGDYAAARRLLEESLALRREIGDRWGTALALGNLGAVALEQGDYPVARMLQEESLALRRRLEDHEGMAISLAALGDQAHFEGDYPTARELHEESLALFRAAGQRGMAAHLLASLALDLHALNRLAEMEASLFECLSIVQEIGSQRLLPYALEGYARLALTEKQPETAAVLYGYTAALRRTLPLPRSPHDQEQHAQALQELKACLSDSKLTTTLRYGENLSLEKALALLPR